MGRSLGLPVQIPVDEPVLELCLESSLRALAHACKEDVGSVRFSDAPVCLDHLEK